MDDQTVCLWLCESAAIARKQPLKQRRTFAVVYRTGRGPTNLGAGWYLCCLIWASPTDDRAVDYYPRQCDGTRLRRSATSKLYRTISAKPFKSGLPSLGHFEFVGFPLRFSSRFNVWLNTRNTRRIFQNYRRYFLNDKIFLPIWVHQFFTGINLAEDSRS